MGLVDSTSTILEAAALHYEFIYVLLIPCEVIQCIFLQQRKWKILF